MDSLYEEDNFQKSIILKNKGGDQVQRSFVRFALPEIKTGDMVINARLVLVSLAEDGKILVFPDIQNFCPLTATTDFRICAPESSFPM